MILTAYLLLVAGFVAPGTAGFVAPGAVDFVSVETMEFVVPGVADFVSVETTEFVVPVTTDLFVAICSVLVAIDFVSVEAICFAFVAALGLAFAGNSDSLTTNLSMASLFRFVFVYWVVLVDFVVLFVFVV